MLPWHRGHPGGAGAQREVNALVNRTLDSRSWRWVAGGGRVVVFGGQELHAISPLTLTRQRVK